MFSSFGLTANCTQEELTRKYRKFAKKYHPDKNAGDARKFLKIQETYHKCMEELKLNSFVDFETIKKNFNENIVEEEYKKDFNMDLFHNTFSKHKSETFGYGNTKFPDKKTTKLGEETTPEEFSRVFTREKKKNIKDYQIQKYRNPEKINSCDSHYENIVEDDNVDYTSNHNYNKKKTAYTDYYKAYTEYNIINVDDEDVIEKNHTIEELKGEIENVKIDENYSIFLERERILENEREEKRIEKINNDKEDKLKKRLMIERQMFNQIE